MKQVHTISLMFLSVAFLIISSSCNNNYPFVSVYGKKLKADLTIHETFDKNMVEWTIEQQPGGSVKVKNGKMDIDDANGCTIWFNKKLHGNIMIEYDAIVINEGGPNDRVSDLNCFWMANDPNHEDLFTNSATRKGKFQNYHHMKLYYVGLGGHDNTKTRFRRYEGGGERPCLPEHDLNDPQFLITAKQINAIRIIVYNGHIQYHRNGQLIYDYYDEAPYTSGYFGIRTYKNHMTIDNFKVYQLK